MAEQLIPGPTEKKELPLEEVREDSIKDQGGNTEYFFLYNENEISPEAREAVEEHRKKYEDGEYHDEESCIYVSFGNTSKGREISIQGNQNTLPKIEKFTGTRILFDERGEPDFLTFSKEIDRLNNFRIQAEAAGVDFLTGLDNRKGWEDYLDSLTYDIQRNILNEEQFITIFYADLNDLKTINDTKGHEEGDKYIIKMVNFLKKVFSRDKDERARWGGDEYGAVAISNQPFEDVAIQRMMQFGEKDLRYCAGIGSFRIKDFLAEIGVTKDMNPEERSRRIKEGLLKKVWEITELEQEAKARSKEMVEEGAERQTIIYRIGKESPFSEI